MRTLLHRPVGRRTILKQGIGLLSAPWLVGPRLNAAGRLTDMRLGIECLLSDYEAQAFEMARELDRLNTERRSIEADMHQSARTSPAGAHLATRAAGGRPRPLKT